MERAGAPPQISTSASVALGLRGSSTEEPALGLFLGAPSPSVGYVRTTPPLL